MKKRILSLALALCIVFTLMPTIAFAADGDVSNAVTAQASSTGDIYYVASVAIPGGTATNSIFLNGNSAEISAAVTDDSYVLNIKVNETTYTYTLCADEDGKVTNAPSIFGGKYIGESATEDVTVTGDQTITVDASVVPYNNYFPITYLFAGGAGDATPYGSRSEGSTYYTAKTEGTVTLNISGYVSAVRGGGSGDSTVTANVINILGGQVYALYGGGNAPYGTVSNLTNETASTCHVGSSKITIGEAAYVSYIHGGGFSIASVGSAEIIVAGRANTVTASGSNGYTGSCSIQIEETAVITPASGYPAITCGWNGYGVGAEITNAGTVNGDVLLGSWNTDNAVSGTSDSISFANTGTVSGTVKLGNVGESIATIAISGDVTLDTSAFDDDMEEFVLDTGTSIILSDGATMLGSLQTADGTVLSAASGSESLVLTAVTTQEASPVASVNGTAYSTLSGALSAANAGDIVTLLSNVDLESEIEKAVTINGNGQTITVKNGGKLSSAVTLDNGSLSVAAAGATSFLASTGSLTISAGSTLSLPNSSGTSEAFVGASDDARLNLSSGSAVLDFSAQSVTLTAGSDASIPTDKTFYLLLGTDQIPLSATIEEGASLTVNGTLRGISGSGEAGSVLTVSGTVDASSGTLEVKKKAVINVDSTGIVKINASKITNQEIIGKANVSAGGKLFLGDTELIGSSDGNIQLSSGSIALDMTALDGTSPAIAISLESADASVPAGKVWTMTMSGIPMNVSVDSSSKLTVAGSRFQVANNSTLTNDGTIIVDSLMIISSEGIVAGSGTITVSNGGALEIKKGSDSIGTLGNDVTNKGTVAYDGDTDAAISGTITMNSSAKVYSDADISAKLSGNYRTLSGKTYAGYDVSSSSTVEKDYANAWEYYISHSSTYSITVSNTTHGGVTASSKSASRGAIVTITATPDEDYKLDTLTVTDTKGNELALTDKGNSTYTFVMPASNVTVNATFAEETTVHACPSEKYTDVDQSLWYHESIDYVIENGLMTGTGATTFAPNTTTSRAMIATLLYRLEGEPDAAGVDFEDVAEGEWYAKAVAWASANKIMSGYGNGVFGPSDPITREQMAATLYRYAVYKGYDVTMQADLSAYTDAGEISTWAVQAMAWANAEELITGCDNKLMPVDGAMRCQVAAILMRFCKNVAK